jgi:hypothetical protein
MLAHVRSCTHFLEAFNPSKQQSASTVEDMGVTVRSFDDVAMSGDEVKLWRRVHEETALGAARVSCAKSLLDALPPFAELLRKDTLSRMGSNADIPEEERCFVQETVSSALLLVHHPLVAGSMDHATRLWKKACHKMLGDGDTEPCSRMDALLENNALQAKVTSPKPV